MFFDFLSADSNQKSKLSILKYYIAIKIFSYHIYKIKKKVTQIEKNVENSIKMKLHTNIFYKGFGSQNKHHTIPKQQTALKSKSFILCINNNNEKFHNPPLCTLIHKISKLEDG